MFMERYAVAWQAEAGEVDGVLGIEKFVDYQSLIMSILIEIM